MTSPGSPTPQRPAGPPVEGEPTWYKDAVIYELHVRAFHDSDGDGVGDFRGLVQKLDYLHDLGVTAIWLLPFYPSPLKDDGYDISDYTSVHPAYGTLRDFQTLLREAHRRGMRVITELVLNHTSDQHQWFQRSRKAAPGSRWRDFYVWSDTPQRYEEARVIFKDFESSNWAWDGDAGAYYWHRFYEHQPDLNFDAPQVREAILKVVDFWLGIGVDGLRLDAVPYLYEREGTNCENLAETHEFLRLLRREIDAKFDARVLIAEANQWPEDAVAYLGEGEECHMAFHFPLMPRLFMAIQMEDRFPIIDILRQTPHIDEGAQWALFLRNHDELTLEMVTDEDRDYMYRAYAADPEARINLGIRRRFAPLLGNHRRKVELMNGLLFSLPGTPIIYYGDEIGMGDNIFLGDRNGVRTPMQWSSDRNAGFSRANPQRLFLPVVIDPEYHYETVNVEAQQSNPHSLLWWTKRLIALRKRHRAFGRGAIEFLYPENAKIFAYIRRYEKETILIVANLSRFVQSVELDLTSERGAVPVELFGRARFPAVGDEPYFLTLGPHGFYWFELEPQEVEEATEAGAPEPAIPSLSAPGGRETIFQGRAKTALEALLPDYLRGRRWFGGKGRTVREVRIVDAIQVTRSAESRSWMTLLRVGYLEGEPETYLLPMAFAAGERAHAIVAEAPQSIIAWVEAKALASPEALHDAVWDEGFCDGLLRAITRRRTFSGWSSELRLRATRELRRLTRDAEEPLKATVLRAEQSNTSIVYGDRLILKLFRRPDRGVNPDLEIGAFLTERARFAHVPPLAGFIEHRAGRDEPTTLGVLQGYVPNQGDAWQRSIDELQRYFERVLAQERADGPPVTTRRPIELAGERPPDEVAEGIGAYIDSARLLGRRTAEMHLALASTADDPAFTAEPFTSFYQRSLYQSARNLTGQALQTVRRALGSIPAEARPDAERLLGLEDEILARFRQSFLGGKISGLRLRTHGDYHLGQVLFTGNDFVIIDFEGEPARPLSERRLKRSPLRDVAGMLRSFEYVAYAALIEGERGMLRPEDLDAAEGWAAVWHTWVGAAFLGEYLDVTEGAAFLPRGRDDIGRLLDGYLLEKAVYELSYDLNNRPAWARIPLRGVLQLLGLRD